MGILCPLYPLCKLPGRGTFDVVRKKVHAPGRQMVGRVSEVLGTGKFLGRGFPFAAPDRSAAPAGPWDRSGFEADVAGIGAWGMFRLWFV